MKHTYQLHGMATTLRMRTTISPEFHPITSSRYYSLSNVLLRGENEAKERGRQARNIYNKCSENSRPEIVFRTDVFRKLTLGAPECCSFYLSFPPSFETQQVPRAYHVFAMEGLNQPGSQLGLSSAVPWVPEAFHARFPVSVKSKLMSSARGRRNEAPRRTREKPLVPRVRQPSNALEISRQP